MVNMKQNPQGKESLLVEDSEQPEYPYGLRINLDEESLKKLGTTELPEVGQGMSLKAQVEVASVSQYDNDKGKHREMSLQITDMELNTQAKSGLYPNSDMN